MGNAWVHGVTRLLPTAPCERCRLNILAFSGATAGPRCPRVSDHWTEAPSSWCPGLSPFPGPRSRTFLRVLRGWLSWFLSSSSSQPRLLL